MSDFTPTADNLKAIDIFSLAGYTVKFGDTLYNDNTKTFGIYVGDVKKYGCSSTRTLTPQFAIKTIKDDAYKAGRDNGITSLQNNLKRLLNIK